MLSGNLREPEPLLSWWRSTTAHPQTNTSIVIYVLQVVRNLYTFSQSTEGVLPQYPLYYDIPHQYLILILKNSPIIL